MPQTEAIVDRLEEAESTEDLNPDGSPADSHSRLTERGPMGAASEWTDGATSLVSKIFLGLEAWSRFVEIGLSQMANRGRGAAVEGREGAFSAQLSSPPARRRPAGGVGSGVGNPKRHPL